MSLMKSAAKLVCLGFAVTISAQAVSNAQQNAAAVPVRVVLVPDPSVHAQMDAARVTRESHAAIEKKLASKVEELQGGESLRSVLDFISDVHGIRIIAEKQVLQDAGVDSIEDVTVDEDLSLSGIRLGSALDILLTQLEDTDTPLDYILEHEVLKITTKEVADQHFDNRVYDVGQMIPDVPVADLVAVVETMADFGERDGGYVKPLGKRLFVRHNRRVHKKIADLLGQLMAGKRRTAGILWRPEGGSNVR